MPNPYHDEAGRFSSKEEMGQAVDRLYEAMAVAKNPVEREEASNAWFNLRTEYEAAQKHEQAGAAGSFIQDTTAAKRAGRPTDRLLVEVDTVGASALTRSTAAYAPSKGADEIWREEYKKIEASNSFNELTEHQAQTLAKLLKSSSAPEVLREDFYFNVSPETKLKVMESYLGHPLDNVRIPAEVARGLLENKGEDSRELVTLALRSDLPFAEKAALADNHGRLAYLAAGNPHAFTDRSDDPEVEQALIAELRRGARNGPITEEQRGGWRALALGSKLRSTRDEIIEKFVGYENYDRSVVDELAQNQYLTSQQEVEVLQSVAWNDAAHFPVIAPRLAGAAYRVKDAEHKAHSQRLDGIIKRHSEIMNGADNSSYVNLTPSQLRSAREALGQLNTVESPTVQEQKRRENLNSVLEAQDGLYNALKRQIEANDATLKKNYVEREHFANEGLRRRLRAATAVRAADISSGEYVDQYYSA